jgi:hypothetical protein
VSQYTKSTNFATKDNLASGDPLKIVKGTEIDTEYNNIATAIATKTDNASAAITGGTITGITDLAIADGGTGASTAATALNNLLPSQGGNANKYLQTDATNATWDSINLGSGDITGTLAVGNGGTGITSFGTGVGIFLGSPTSSNLASAVTDETGTGALVFANSPTLVTPALGTPASGVATNLTGLPLSTGISGLGTGVATALAINTPNTGAIVVSGGALGTPSSGTVTNLTGSAFININGTVGNSTPNSGSFTTLNTSSTVTINGGTANGIGFLNGSKVFTTGTVLKFDGTNITSDRSSGTAYSGTSFFTWANGIVLNNSATPATGLLNSLYFTNNANMQNVFGVVQNASGYGDFVWAGYSGSYAEAMRLTSSGLAVTGTISATTAIATTSGGTGLTSFTSGGVVFASSSSVLATGSALTFNGTTLTVNSDGIAHTITRGSSNGYLYHNGNAGSADLTLQSQNGSVKLFTESGSGGTIKMGVEGSEVARFTSSSFYTASGINVGIGTSSPSTKLTVYDATTPQVTFNNGTSTFIVGNNSGGNNKILYGTGAYPMIFYTNATEAMRIDSSGNLLVGTTTFGQPDVNGAAIGPADGAFRSHHATGTSSGTIHAYFTYGGLGIGSITQSGTTAVAYNTSSDYRLKNTITPMTGALAKVALLKPCTYKWNADGSDGEGFIAHELAEVVPDCVSGAKDAVNADGKPEYQGIDTSFLVATLTAAIQEQQAIIESLKARLDAANL